MNLIQELRQLDEAKKKKKPFDFEAWGERMKNLSPEEQRKAFANFGGTPPDPATSPDASYRNADQQRGPTPGGEGGSDTTRSNQPIARPHSNGGSIRRVVQGIAPPTPQQGEKFETEEQGEAAKDFLKGKKKGKPKQQEFKFEARLMQALLSNEEMLLEFTSKNYGRRGHTKKMGGVKKAALTAAAAAALFAGSYHGTHAIHKKITKEPQKTHQTQGHEGHGVSADEDEIGDSSKRLEKGPSGQVGEDPSIDKRFSKKPKSLGKGRVTKDSGL